MSDGVSRRELFRRAAIYGGSLWIAVDLPCPAAPRAAQASSESQLLTPEQWRTVEAITGRIIPSDHEPGAVEAGCVQFIDRALAHEDDHWRPVYEAGLPALDAAARRRFGSRFTALGPAEQDELLVAVEAGDVEGWPPDAVPPAEFFEVIRIHTLWGFLADPRYGGNRGYVGWKLVGYPGPRHALGGYTAEQQLGLAPVETVWGGKL